MPSSFAIEMIERSGPNFHVLDASFALTDLYDKKSRLSIIRADHG